MMDWVVSEEIGWYLVMCGLLVFDPCFYINSAWPSITLYILYSQSR